MAVLYHERWEVETAYFELKSTILGGRVLRARTPDGIDQEVYALLVTYQVLRTAIADAAGTVPGTDPDRASFAVALNAARDQVILAAASSPAPSPTWPDIGRLVGQPDAQQAAARQPPLVKRAMSRYNARGKVDRRTRKATLAIAILGAPFDTRRRTLTNRPWATDPVDWHRAPGRSGGSGSAGSIQTLVIFPLDGSRKRSCVGTQPGPGSTAWACLRRPPARRPDGPPGSARSSGGRSATADATSSAY